jgi:non-ribosomal peptide synthetase component F
VVLALASTTTTFDISLVELILPLCVGATCVVADSDTVRDPAALGEVLEFGFESQDGIHAFSGAELQGRAWACR